MNDLETAMDIKKLHLVYFSPTGTTQSILRAAAKSFNIENVEHDLTNSELRSLFKPNCRYNTTYKAKI